MSKNEWIIRAATLDDATALSALAESTFRETFRDGNTESDLNDYCAASFGADIQARELADAATLTLVVEREGHLIAYSQLIANKTQAVVEAVRPIELKRFYVDKAFQGTPLALELMRASEDRAKAAGADVVWLGVWERNPRAIRFYQKSGYQEVGSHTFTVGSDAQRDLVMSRRLV
jgi:ribosomal protein S18 acetylase RimI-like enzyme